MENCDDLARFWIRLIGAFLIDGITTMWEGLSMILYDATLFYFAAMLYDAFGHLVWIRIRCAGAHNIVTRPDNFLVASCHISFY